MYTEYYIANKACRQSPCPCYLFPRRTAFLTMREFFTPAAENTFAPGSVLVGGDAKLSIVVGDFWERKGFSAGGGRPELVFPLANAKLGVRFAAPNLNAGVAPTAGGAANVEEPWSPENSPPPPCIVENFSAVKTCTHTHTHESRTYMSILSP